MPQLNLKEALFNTPAGEKWGKIGFVRRAGVVVPLFSVQSSQSIGIGDFQDLKLVIDFCSKSRLSILQLLPLNALGASFCPYDALSSFALEPSYICLHNIKESPKERINAIKSSFSMGAGYVNYRVKEEKLEFLREIYALNKDLEDSELKSFCEMNSYWINDYSLFIVIKNYHKGLPWYEWEEKYKNRDPGALKAFAFEYNNDILFQVWLQWELYKQLKEVKNYAQSKNVLIKGDLPILVSRDSADVWAHQGFFKLEYAAGAPPDMYCSRGQRWGMPTYNWQAIATDSYEYLKERLKYAQQFYDILRIDHVVGLFRIWSIPYNEPKENHGLNGFFDPRDEHLWEGHGRTILSVMQENTKMLLCAEDLGVIPKVCTKALVELGIPGNDVQRWVKDWDVKHDFRSPDEYRLFSVAMLSTHDTTPWAAWWEYEAGTIDENLFMRKCAERSIDYPYAKHELFDPEFSRYGRLRWKNSITSADILVHVLRKKREEVADFIGLYENSYREKEKLWVAFGLSGAMREKSDKDIIKAAFKITLSSCAVFSVEFIFDWLGLSKDILINDPYQYRINIPGAISEKNWSQVLPIPLEKLLQHEVCGKIKEMVLASGRI